MNRPCPQMQDEIADYVLGALDAPQAQALQEHVSHCPGCREYLENLQRHGDMLTELGRQIDAGMPARQERVIAALQNVEPQADRALPFIGGFVRTAVAAVLLLGAGITIGRWTAPRPVDAERLRSDLQASLAPAIQASVLAEVDQRLETGISAGNAALAEQLRRDLRTFANNSQALMSRQYVELVSLIEAGREKDREQVARALEQIKRRTDRGLYSLAVRTADSSATVQN